MNASIHTTTWDKLKDRYTEYLAGYHTQPVITQYVDKDGVEFTDVHYEEFPIPKCKIPLYMFAGALDLLCFLVDNVESKTC